MGNMSSIQLLSSGSNKLSPGTDKKSHDLDGRHVDLGRHSERLHNDPSGSKERVKRCDSDATNFSSSTNSFKQTVPLRMHAHQSADAHYQKRPLASASGLRTGPPGGHGKRLHSHDSTVSSSTFKTSTTRSSVSSNNSSRMRFHSTATDSTTIPLSRSVSTSAPHRSLEQSISANSTSYNSTSYNSTSYGSSDVILGPVDETPSPNMRPSSLFGHREGSDLDHQEGSDLESGHHRGSASSASGEHRGSASSASGREEMERIQREIPRLCHECARQEALLAKKKAKNKNKPKRNHIRLDDLELEEKMNRYFKKLTLNHETNQRALATDEPKKLKNSGSESKDSTITDHSLSSEGDGNKNKATTSSSSQVTTESRLSSSSTDGDRFHSQSEDARVNQFFLKCEKQPYIQVNPTCEAYQSADSNNSNLGNDPSSHIDSDHDYRGDIFLFVDREEGESNSRSPSTLSVRTAVAVGGTSGGGRDSRTGTLTPEPGDTCDTMTRLLVDCTSGQSAGGQGVTRSLVDVRPAAQRKTSSAAHSTDHPIHVTTPESQHVYSSSASASSCQLSTDAKGATKEEESKEGGGTKIKFKDGGKRKVSSESSLKSSIKNIPSLVWRSFSSQNTSISSQERSREREQSGKKKEFEIEEPLLNIRR